MTLAGFSVSSQMGTILAYGFGILMLVIIARTFLFPFKLLLKLLYNAFIGGVMLLIVNFVGSYFHYSMPLNPITALLAGFLGIPGVILIAILQYLVL